MADKRRKIRELRRKKKQKTAEAPVVRRETKRGGLYGLYEHRYKQLLIIPFTLLLLAVISILVQQATTGDFINRGVSLKGGITVTVPIHNLNAENLQDYLRTQFPLSDISVRSISELGQQQAVIIDSADVTEEELVTALEAQVPNVRDIYSVETIGSALSETFFHQTVTAILIAFVFMAIVVFLYFRTFIPSLAVILAAISDIIITLAIVNIIGVKLSTAGIAAFLMLIGYSVDTDILLSTRILKRKEGTIFQRTIGAMKTGLTMSITTMVAVSVGLIVSQSEVISQIMMIILIGLFVDLIMTWIQNAGILRWYMENHGKS